MNDKLGIPRVQALKQAGEKIVALTAYDTSFAAILDTAGVDIALVGDSLGMVLQGQEDTLSVTMDDMVYHSSLVSRACRRALVVVDMPYLSYETPALACANARRLVQEGGAEVVKLEGGEEQAQTVAHLVEQGIPVCGHVGMQPQSVRAYGGFKVQGREQHQAQRIMAGALALQRAGAAMVVLECIPASLAARISRALTIPTIGIGAGEQCDGQVLVIYDMLGISPYRPHLAKNFLAGSGSVSAAIEEYVRAVRAGEFPGSEHSFK
ncbi:MAG: 3-methyl-2-oxobutanoate hydroxymethyltransferase [Gammaproteobacteria bacterium]|nr:3-methyl-2-oxobutanoate hydroxymethyltransferase [Gammaproteobacteria bacterium]MCY4337609.1 3-methyl-2-oxobutanoate hydroxymethyltransferase [Gammaproteobacteria bacterium]